MRLPVARQKRTRPTAITLTGKHLEIAWSDGTSSQALLSELRRSCPCAMCREARRASEPSATGELPVLEGEAETATAEALRFEHVGRYGIRITWADGHDTGIYTFEALREAG